MLNNFCFQNPTKLIMGKGMIAQLSRQENNDYFRRWQRKEKRSI